MRSVVVVLPASMCAAMPIFRVRSSVYWRPAAFTDLLFSTTASIAILETKNAPSRSAFGARRLIIQLPAKMCKCLVCLGHLMDFIPFPDGIALALVGFQNLGGQGFLHGHALARICKINQPAHRQRKLAVGGDFHRHLV